MERSRERTGTVAVSERRSSGTDSGRMVIQTGFKSWLYKRLDKKGEIDLAGMVTGLILVLVLILVFSAFSGPISTAINGTYVGGGAAAALWDGIVFLLIVLAVILAIVTWAMSKVNVGGRGG